MSTYHPTFRKSTYATWTRMSKLHIPRIAKFSTGQHFGVFGKMPYLRYTPIWSKLGGWRYTKQYIIRRDFHGRLHPKLTLLHAEICRFLTPPKMVFFRILVIFDDFAKLCKFAHFAHLVFWHIASWHVSKCHVDEIGTRHDLEIMMAFQKC